MNIDLLDVGRPRFGDALLCRSGGKTILIDGAHRQVGTPKSYDLLLSQLRSLLDAPRGPIPLDLLIVSHAHADHIGCLPDLIQDEIVVPRWSLLTSPTDAGLDPQTIAAAETVGFKDAYLSLREESDDGDDPVEGQASSDLPERYSGMFTKLGELGRVVRSGSESGYSELQDSFADIGMHILGPTPKMIEATRGQIAVATQTLTALRALADDEGMSLASEKSQIRQIAWDLRSQVNMQSVVMTLDSGGGRSLFTGDCQFGMPTHAGAIAQEADAMFDVIRSGRPYAFVKMPHHGSENGLTKPLLNELVSTGLFGISTGWSSKDHPDPDVLNALAANHSQFERTDQNGQVQVVLNTGKPVERTRTLGVPNDSSPPTGKRE